MIKIIGGIVICISTALMGVKKALITEHRLDILNEFEKSLVLLKGEIKYSAASLPEAILSVSNRTCGDIKIFYERLYGQTIDNHAMDFKKIWEAKVLECFKEGMVDGEDCKVINDLGAQLGHLDISMQIRAIELCMSRLSERQLKAANEIKEKSKLYKTVGLASGALITLVLL